MTISGPLVTLARPALGFTIAAMVGSGTSASAQPRAAAPSALTFDVSARVSAPQTGGPQQLIQARVSLSGSRARIETTSGGQRSIVVFAPPYLYRLLPEAKAGVRWKLNPAQTSPFGAFDPQQLLRDPSRLRALLVQQGAKRVGTGTQNGVAVEVFQLSAPKGRLQKAKAWLRQSDALPVRLEASSGGIQVVASWRNYARPKLADSLFGAPSGFRIRQATGAPPLAGL